MTGTAASRDYPKAARLRRRAEYLELQRDGQRRHTAHLVIIRRAASGARSRLGVTVSKRVGNSVVRSRVKRLLREVFRHRQAELTPPADVVVIAKPGADTLTYAQAATEFAKAFDLPIGG
jgi:ribonuclease P protein component